MTEMTEIPLDNPFSAPVYFLETTASSMLDARALAARGAPHGTVVAADFQEAGRGRVANRSWQAERGQNLLFTLLLRYPGVAAIPPALTLRTALALLQAVERLAPALRGSLRVKWPNDLMIPVNGAYRKTAGILAEGDGSCVYLGVGVNVGQTRFPETIQDKAGSLALALGEAGLPGNARCSLLAAFLAQLYADIAGPAAAPAWRERLEERLYLKGSRARFLAGAADAGRAVEGRIYGVGAGGELLLQTAEGIEAFVTGEFSVGSDMM